MPALERRNASESLSASSSSMMCTRSLALIAELLRRRRPQGKAEHGTPTGTLLDPDSPAMPLDNGARNRQPDAHAVLLRCDERLKQLVGDIRCNARAGVGDLNEHFLVVGSD